MGFRIRNPHLLAVGWQWHTQPAFRHITTAVLHYAKIFCFMFTLFLSTSKFICFVREGTGNLGLIHGQ